MLNTLILICLVSKILTIIIIPFQTYNPLLTKNNTLLELIKTSSDKSIVDTILRNLIYTNLNIGEKNQQISTFLEMRTKYFDIRDSSIHGLQKGMQIKNSNMTFNKNYLMKSIFKNTYYNSSESKSYKYVKDCYDFIFDFISIKNFCGNETVFLIQKNNIKDQEMIKPIDLYIKFKEKDYSDHRPGVIGFSYYSEFISELKERNEINKYDFSFKYTNTLEEKGELIIGDLPHMHDNDNYNETNLRTAKIIKETIKWDINFDIYIVPKNQSEKDFYFGNFFHKENY